jgi:hypothetical protein
MSSLNFAAAAIMARALSFTPDGAMPSAQLIVPSAVAFDDAVRDHFQKDIACSPDAVLSLSCRYLFALGTPEDRLCLPLVAAKPPSVRAAVVG